MFRHPWIPVTALVLVTLTGCSGTPGPDTVAAPAPPASHRPPHASSGDHVRSVGTKVSVAGGQADVTVYSYRQPVAANGPRPDRSGYIWSAADVKVCVHADSQVSRDPWTLVYADHKAAKPSTIGNSQFPKPAYPLGDKNMKSGQCARGWVTFAVPKTHKPTMVEYSLPDGTIVDWNARAARPAADT